jgi:hypothetical protein
MARRNVYLLRFQSYSNVGGALYLPYGSPAAALREKELPAHV